MKENLDIPSLDALTGDQRGEVNRYLRRIIKEVRVYGKKVAWRNTLMILEVVFKNGKRIFIEDRKDRELRFLDDTEQAKGGDLKLTGRRYREVDYWRLVSASDGKAYFSLNPIYPDTQKSLTSLFIQLSNHPDPADTRYSRLKRLPLDRSHQGLP